MKRKLNSQVADGVKYVFSFVPKSHLADWGVTPALPPSLALFEHQCPLL